MLSDLDSEKKFELARKLSIDPTKRFLITKSYIIVNTEFKT